MSSSLHIPQCFLYDPRLGGESDADKKILFYHPPTTPLAEQVSTVGLCESIAVFSSQFSSEGCESLHTQMGRLMSWQCEPNYWIVLYMPHETAAGGGGKKGASPASAPPSPRTSTMSSTSSASSKADSSTGGGEEHLPPNEEALQDCTLQELLKRIYSALRLACGPLSEVAASRGADGLRGLLSDVLPLLLRVLIPAGEEDGRRLDLLDTVDGMRFLVVDRRLYLRVQYVLNLILCTQRCVKQVMLLQGDQMVWSSLTREATSVVHRAVASVVAPSLQIPTKTLEAFHPSRAASLPDEALLFAIALIQRQLRSVAKSAPAAGGFVCGAADATQDPYSAVRVPAVYIEKQPGTYGSEFSHPAPSNAPEAEAPEPSSEPTPPPSPPEDGEGGGGEAAESSSAAAVAAAIAAVDISEGAAPSPAAEGSSKASGKQPVVESGGGEERDDAGNGGEAGSSTDPPPPLPLDAPPDGPPRRNSSDPSSLAATHFSVSSPPPGPPGAGPLWKYRLVVFQLQQTSIVMLVDEYSPNWTQPSWYSQLQAQIVPELQGLASQLAETQSKLAAVEDNHRFIYFNRLNLVLKSSIRAMRAGLTGRLGLHNEPKQLLNRLHADLSGEHKVREVALQTAGAHGWLVGHASDSRGFYLLLDGRDCTWSEVHQEVQSLCAQHFSNIFLE